jgi:hypothetical protein
MSSLALNGPGAIAFHRSGDGKEGLTLKLVMAPASFVYDPQNSAAG